MIIICFSFYKMQNSNQFVSKKLDKTEIIQPFTNQYCRYTYADPFECFLFLFSFLLLNADPILLWNYTENTVASCVCILYILFFFLLINMNYVSKNIVATMMLIESIRAKYETRIRFFPTVLLLLLLNGKINL